MTRLSLALSVLAALVLASTAAAVGSSTCDGLHVVKDVTTMSSDTKAAIVKGIYRLKSMTSSYDPTLNAWDYFVNLHREAVRPGNVIHAAHYFFPWHREVVNRFTKELGRAMGVNSTSTGWTYWDWTKPESTAALFTDDFLGGSGDPNNDYVVSSGPFSVGNWHINADLAVLPGAMKTGGLVRSHGNGLQMCLDPQHNSYLLDTVYNPPTVDKQASVGPFRLLSDVGPPTDTLLYMKPDITNLDCPWHNHTCIRRYTNATSELQCKHYASTLPTLQDFTRCMVTLHPYTGDNPAPMNTEDPWKTTSDYYVNQSFWRACTEGLDASDIYTYGVERIGASIHPPHGATHTYLGGSVATPNSPNDPVFFALHWNIDRYWAEYTVQSGNHWWLSGPGAPLLDKPIPLLANPQVTPRETLNTASYGYTFDTVC